MTSDPLLLEIAKSPPRPPPSAAQAPRAAAHQGSPGPAGEKGAAGASAGPEVRPQAAPQLRGAMSSRSLDPATPQFSPTAVR